MKTQEIHDFYKDKEHTPSPITDRLVESGYSQTSEGYIKKALEEGLIQSRSETPSQWWHLMESYLPVAVIPNQVKCGELIVWMAEVSGSVGEKELNELVDKVLENKNDRRAGNKEIKRVCLKRIRETVKGHANGNISRKIM